MAVIVRKREGESVNTLLYRFNRKVMQSGILREAKQRRFYQRKENKNQRRRSALYRARKRAEIEKRKKLGDL